jgi:hypothetical protein
MGFWRFHPSFKGNLFSILIGSGGASHSFPKRSIELQGPDNTGDA